MPIRLDPAATSSSTKSGPDGLLWFSLRGAEAIGSLDPRAADPVSSLRLFESPTIAGPAALFVTPDGRVWWVNSSADTVGTLDPVSGEITALEVFTGSPRAWTQTADGRLWLTTREPVGLLSFDPVDPVGTALHVTDERLREPDGVWVGADSGVWFADSAANAIGRYQPGASGPNAWRFVGSPPEVEGPFDIKTGPDPAGGSLWFTNKAGNTIGRISVLP